MDVPDDLRNTRKEGRKAEDSQCVRKNPKRREEKRRGKPCCVK